MSFLCCSHHGQDDKKVAQSDAAKKIEEEKKKNGPGLIHLVSEASDEYKSIKLSIASLQLVTKDDRKIPLPVGKSLNLLDYTEKDKASVLVYQKDAPKGQGYQALRIMLDQGKGKHSVTPAGSNTAMELVIPEQLQHGIPVPMPGRLSATGPYEIYILFEAGRSIQRSQTPGDASKEIFTLRPQVLAVNQLDCADVRGKFSGPDARGGITVTAQATDPAYSDAAVYRSVRTNAHGEYKVDLMPLSVQKSWRVVALPVAGERMFPPSLSPALDFTQSRNALLGEKRVTMLPVGTQGKVEGIIAAGLPADSHDEIDVLQALAEESATKLSTQYSVGPVLPHPEPAATPQAPPDKVEAKEPVRYLVHRVLAKPGPGGMASSFAFELPAGHYWVRQTRVRLNAQGAASPSGNPVTRRIEVLANETVTVKFENEEVPGTKAELKDEPGRRIDLKGKVDPKGKAAPWAKVDLKGKAEPKIEPKIEPNLEFKSRGKVHPKIQRLIDELGAKFEPKRRTESKQPRPEQKDEPRHIPGPPEPPEPKRPTRVTPSEDLPGGQPSPSHSHKAGDKGQPAPAHSAGAGGQAAGAAGQAAGAEGQAAGAAGQAAGAAGQAAGAEGQAADAAGQAAGAAGQAAGAAGQAADAAGQAAGAAGQAADAAGQAAGAAGQPAGPAPANGRGLFSWLFGRR